MNSQRRAPHAPELFRAVQRQFRAHNGASVMFACVAAVDKLSKRKQTRLLFEMTWLASAFAKRLPQDVVAEILDELGDPRTSIVRRLVTPEE